MATDSPPLTSVPASRRRFLSAALASAPILPGLGWAREAESEDNDSHRSRSTGTAAASVLRTRLRAEIDKVRLVDAHEHLPGEAQWLGAAPDLVSLIGYSGGDLVCAGMPKDAIQLGQSPGETWKAMRPYWRHVRNMGAGQLCRRALRMFFGVDDLTDANIGTVQNRLVDLARPGTYRQLLGHDHGIDVCLNVGLDDIIGPGSASDLFAPLLYTSPFAMVQNREDIDRLQKLADKDIYSLATYLEALDTVLERCKDNGMVGIKWHTLAYVREIDYGIPNPIDAEKCLSRIFHMPVAGGGLSRTSVGIHEMRPFQDLIQHHLVRRAIDMDIPIQIHTGIFGGSYGGQIQNARPSHLVNLFLQYPQARFDLLHASYPYMGELTALVKLFPNVYINPSWFDVLSPRAARSYLQDWVSSVPTNKVFVFGADQFSVFLSCAYAQLVKDNLSDVLSQEVVERNMSEEQALDVAVSMLRTNAWDYFRLEQHWEKRHKTETDANSGPNSSFRRGPSCEVGCCSENALPESRSARKSSPSPSPWPG